MGSEMCIRDRVCLKTARSKEPDINCTELVSKDSVAAPDVCLLYTSDAADDSLRVDLGGRRIIKKSFVV